LELILDANGVAVKLGAGVAAVEQYYAEHRAARKQPVTV
jgi:hypothetical protein